MGSKDGLQIFIKDESCRLDSPHEVPNVIDLLDEGSETTTATLLLNKDTCFIKRFKRWRASDELNEWQSVSDGLIKELYEDVVE